MRTGRTAIPLNAPYEIYSVARLLYHCGVTVRMDYEARASGACSGRVPGAFRRFFGYKCSGLMKRSRSAKKWLAFITSNMEWNSPMYYAFDNGVSGHAVVCDGVSNDYWIHINMGWGGSHDAWYDVDGVRDFRYNHRAIGFIRPVGAY